MDQTFLEWNNSAGGPRWKDLFSLASQLRSTSSARLPVVFGVINDLPCKVGSTARLFADDCLLYQTINAYEDTTALQEYISYNSGNTVDK